MSDLLKYIVFADETIFLCTGDNPEQLLNMAQNELCKLKSWVDKNKLLPNISKTKFMLFGDRKIAHKLELATDDVFIERVYESKFRGIF